jgi:hypothetical protein
MSENKFLKNLNQSNSQLPVLTSPASPSVPVKPTPPQPLPQPESNPAEYDPIKRLADELSRHSRAIEGLNSRIDRLEKRPQPATQAELQTLLGEARKGVHFTINSEAIARLVVPDLIKELPSPTGIQAAVKAGASAITAAAEAASDRIERAGSGAVSRIEWASRRKADAFAGRIGFTSWQAAAGVLAGFVLLLVLVSFLNREREMALAQARAETQAVREFTDWVKAQPEGKKLYDRFYNP